MLRKKIILTFPPKIVEEPITYKLIKDFGLWINILRAKIDSSNGGKLVIELKGEKKQIEEGLRFIKDAKVGVEFLKQEVIWNKDKCIDCGACVSICPVGALSLDKETFKLQFNYEECVVCGYCVEACPLQAIEVKF
ncbi:MAG: 4Fe-4S binding protein [Candidatus Atribacteria bacterium]|nr:4Fe-4S binding protein [Candidatus Atribacteria bacterium]